MKTKDREKQVSGVRYQVSGKKSEVRGPKSEFGEQSPESEAISPEYARSNSVSCLLTPVFRLLPPTSVLVRHVLCG
jgi:hypothetical protein